VIVRPVVFVQREPFWIWDRVNNVFRSVHVHVISEEITIKLDKILTSIVTNGNKTKDLFLIDDIVLFLYLVLVHQANGNVRIILVLEHVQ